jgi:hypothetical protein
MTHRLFWKALWALCWYDLWLARREFKLLYKNVRQRRVAPKTWTTDDVDRICRAVALACMWYPKETLCLQRSVVAVNLLRDEGVPAVMVIGAQQLPLRSHAWVEVEGRVVNDKQHICSTYARLESC